MRVWACMCVCPCVSVCVCLCVNMRMCEEAGEGLHEAGLAAHSIKPAAPPLQHVVS